jgi:multimeric flavodoxin WrbA
MKTMRVVAFNGSPHRDGVIAAGFALIRAELVAADIETEIVEAGGRNLRGCLDCHGCRKPGATGCVLRDDGQNAGFVNECRAKAENADAVILGSPVYYGGIAGACKCFLDRLFFQGARLDYKPAAAVTSLRRSGGIATYHQLCNYLTLSGAVIVPTCYWNVIHGNTAAEFAEDKEAASIMKAVGKNLAWLLQSLEVAKKTVPYPQHEPRDWTNFIHPPAVEA